MPEILRRPKTRPRYPSVGRQWSGILLICLAIGVIELISREWHKVQNPAAIVLLVTIAVTVWSGWRAGIIATAISFAYFLVLLAKPGPFLHYSQQIVLQLISAAFLFLLFVCGIGLAQNRLRAAGLREFDAREIAEAESLQRQQTEESLRSSEDLRKLVVESATDAIVVTNELGIITLWNPQAERIFGWDGAEVIGRGIGETVLPGAEADTTANTLRRFAEPDQQSHGAERVDLSAMTKSGSEIPVELTVVPYLGEHHQIYIGFFRDLTEQRKLGERLRQAQKLEAIGTLAAGVAHDFNNILSALSGNLTLARADIPADHIAQESLSEGEKAVARATQVVRQILSFSSARELSSDPIDVKSTIESAISLLRATIPATTVIEANFEEDIPAIRADGTDIHQIVLNLGINANAALNGEAGTFEVQIRRLALDEATAKSLLSIEPGEYVRLSFGDTGCGMEKAVMDRIFEPFFTTKAHGEGTGLGLSVVFGIVERYRGAISVYSEPGAGTVFHIYFPVAETGNLAASETKSRPVEHGSGERILYVDDDDALVFMMSRMLRRLGYEVAGFQHSREALAAVKAHPDSFDLVISDMSMPHLDGPALVTELQAIRPNLPIVMVTGYIRPKDLERATQLGIRELLLKPNSVQEMGETIHRVFAEIRAEKTSNGPNLK